VSGNFGALGICDPSSTANDFYYGIAVHHERGEIWVCNVLRNRIDVLDFEGNCLYQLHGQSSQLPPPP
jgi:DNA-binding beta-propeller fold protein YncE